MADKAAQLAQVLVRQGERINLSLQQWQKDAETSDSPDVLQGRIEAGVALSNALRKDVEAWMSVNELYTLAGRDDVPELDEEYEIGRLRRELRMARSNIDHLRLRVAELEEVLGASQVDPDPGPDETH